MRRFEDRTAIVTGGSLGIGRAVAERLTSEGARVLITGRNAERLQQAAREIGGDVITVSGDIADDGAPEEIVDLAMRRWGRIDVLVNNAGAHDKSGFLEQSRDDWGYVLAVCLTGPYFLAQQCAREMSKQGKGAIVNIASIDAHGFDGDTMAYGAAKAALLNVTKYMAALLAPHGVRVNAVSPGVVDTPLLASYPGLHETLSREVTRAPLKRLIAPDEIAAAVLFLASDESSATTGIEHVVDAGLLADLYLGPTIED
jgi:NAD(P)-dependent dehydrogenase (short-subunit alcohol dehydrogenase family)